jgi:hypothetical protein
MYWPEDEAETFGVVTVVPSDTQNLSDSIVLRRFVLIRGEV